MRDEKEERKKQARSNKQTRQSNTAHPRQSLGGEEGGGGEGERGTLPPFSSHFLGGGNLSSHYKYNNYMYMYMCAVLLCLVCLFDLDCFFLSSFSSLI